MQRENLPLDQFHLPIFAALNERWMLLTAGAFMPNGFNSMTISWGGLGFIWDKPLAIVVVRPGRHTYRFMEQADGFTLCAFPPAYRDALTICGTKSGRDTDKIREAGLTPLASTRVRAPGFEEAELILECRKVYFQDLQSAQFLAPELASHYPRKDYHRMYFGEVLAASGVPAYK